MRNLNIYDDYEDYDDYENESYIKKMRSDKRRKGKGNKKGHQRVQRESDIWMEILEENPTATYIPDNLAEDTPQESIEIENISVNEETPTQNSVDSAAITATSNENKHQFIPGPNTHTIKGNIIDFDRVAAVEKIDNLHNGKTTFGIKFIFVGSKGTYRIAWFNQNMRERDAVYSTELTFWHNLQENN